MKVKGQFNNSSHKKAPTPEFFVVKRKQNKWNNHFLRNPFGCEGFSVKLFAQRFPSYAYLQRSWAFEDDISAEFKWRCGGCELCVGAEKEKDQ